MHQPARALDRSVLAVEAADDLDVVFQLVGFAVSSGGFADYIALPIFDRVTAQRHNFEGAADADGIVPLRIIDQLDFLRLEVVGEASQSGVFDSPIGKSR